MTTPLRAGRTTQDPRLDLIPPVDDHHKVKYPMLAPSQVWDNPAPVPIAYGVNWYRNFYADRLIERTERSRKTFWIPEGDPGTLEGGHCICGEPDHPGRQDTTGWWELYDQGQEGACVGFGWSRVMTLLNRRRYAAREFYFEVQREDPWPGGAYPGADPQYEGTSVRSGSDVLRTKGEVGWSRGKSTGLWAPQDGILAVRWPKTMDELLQACGRQGQDSIIWLNSWGKQGYPHRVHVPLSIINRLVFAEDGDAGIPTDR